MFDRNSIQSKRPIDVIDKAESFAFWICCLKPYETRNSWQSTGQNWQVFSQISPKFAMKSTNFRPWKIFTVEKIAFVFFYSLEFLSLFFFCYWKRPKRTVKSNWIVTFHILSRPSRSALAFSFSLIIFNFSSRFADFCSKIQSKN